MEDNFSIRETLGKQMELLAERSTELTDLGELLLVCREIRNLAILLAAVRKQDLLRYSYEQ